MTRSSSILGPILAALLLLAPALASAAAGCPGCCAAPAPCHEEPAGCTELARDGSVCCELVATAPPPAAKRGDEGANAPAVPVRRSRSVPAPASASAPGRAPDLAAAVSPLRLSVVLRI